MSLSITTSVKQSTCLNVRLLVEELMQVSTEGIVVIQVVDDIKLSGVKATARIEGEKIYIDYPEGATGKCKVAFEAVLV